MPSNSTIRTLRRKITTFKNFIRNIVYPVHVETLWVLIALVNGLHFADKIPSYGLVKWLTGFEMFAGATVPRQVVICSLVAFVYWITISRIARYILKILLMYKGYMHENKRTGVSLTTKVWAMLLKALVTWNPPSLYSFQEALPRLPVPKLNETISRYLRSMRPLLNDTEHEALSRRADEFLNGIGKKCQWYLVLKSWWSTNYVTDWWDEFIYLRRRASLMINSNCYVSDHFERITRSQSARAANIIHLTFLMRKRLEREEFEPFMVQGIVPLCSWQYRRMFNTFREPDTEKDRLVHFAESDHVALYHKGCFYKIVVYHQGRLLNPMELKHQIDQILNANATTTDSERNLSSLTAMDRTKWAEVRAQYFSTGVNRESLHAIESAAFFLALDDKPFELSFDCPQANLDNQARMLLHGNGNDRWFDKSFTLVITSDAQFGLNIEHSWSDGPIIGHVYEQIMYDDYFCYDESGNLKDSASPTSRPPPPTRLSWDFNSRLAETIREAYSDALKMIEEVDHRIVLHKSFGKGFIKTCKVSPDAYIQMALQLANYREFGKFNLTYEASMTRLYREGRTETVRACTMESSTWVKAMEDKTSTTEEKVRLLQDACRTHQSNYVDAMCGRGVDRHLFCLYVVSKHLKLDSPFLQEAVSEPWRLSTSQTPMGQSAKIDFKKYPGFLNPGAGFGPVTYDGYSVSYIISGEDLLSFHVSSKRSCPTTDSSRFIDRIVQAMADIRKLFEDYEKERQLK
ncbi:Carnitine O-palmitoyltransferase 1, liver isoform [Pseudolycoriella hygida]|uniref:carnitine O-palmitoyltransferase n=1 Tax=Pseudolycoriella hygida TaxID=35572 RepID=A0A9Q0S3G5_9DIPT|nr:Carnitine O-palmitoyltransferase 1, liver isoform [Pseudolycoriella hygida]